MLFTAEHTFGDIEGKSVCDLGCGCGMLTIGCALMDASYVLGIDIDDDAIETAAQNTDEFDMQDRVDLVRADVGVPVTPLFARLAKRFDTVVLNPPFGTKNNKGIDMLFLQRALELSRGAVYSLHKSSTREVTLLFYFILFFVYLFIVLLSLPSTSSGRPKIGGSPAKSSQSSGTTWMRPTNSTRRNRSTLKSIFSVSHFLLLLLLLVHPHDWCRITCRFTFSKNKRNF